MGRQAFPIIGGLVGAAAAAFLSGGTATWQGYEAGFALGAAIGGIAGSYIDPLVIQGNTIGDRSVQVAAEGGVRAIMYGACCVSATCIIARGDRKVVKKKQSNGKGAPSSTANEYVYWTFAIGLGEALVNGGITRIWQDDNLVYDLTPGASISQEDNNSFAAKFKFYSGAEDQLPDPDLQAFLGDDTPYFRGTAYVVFPQFDLTQTAERIPQFKFEVNDTFYYRNWGSDIIGEVVDITSGIENIFFELNTLTPEHIVTVSKHTGQTNKAWSYWPTDEEAFALGYQPWASSFRVSMDNGPFKGYWGEEFNPDGTSPRFNTPDDAETWSINNPIRFEGATNYRFSIRDTTLLNRPGLSLQIDESYVGGTLLLETIVSDLLLRSGMTSDQFDASVLDMSVAGLCIQDTATGASAITAIVAPYFCDPTEKDGKLIWIKRGADVVRTLTLDDLTEEPDVASRENTIEYPAKLSFFYQSSLTGYATTKATSYRYSPQADSSGEGSVTTPVTFVDPDEPAQIAQKLHKVAWTEAEGSFTWKVGLHCLDLLPGDCVGLFLRGIATRARITAIENDINSLTLTMLKDRQSSYTSHVTGTPLPLPTPPQPATMSRAVLAVLDIPALTDNDDQLCYYTAMAGSSQVWNGGQLQRSLDDGATWVVIQDVSTDATMGKLTVAMTATSAEYTDTTNTVTVQLFDSRNDLLAFSDTTFLQEQGAIAIQLADGTWEVMQYRDATDGGNGLWTLSYLQRGRLTTTPGVHAVGSLFVLLDQYLQKNSAQVAWLGGTLKHRAVSYGTSADDATVVSTVYTGASQREWPPASASYELTGSNVHVFDIVARHRFGTELLPIPSSNFIGFRLTCSDGVTATSVDITATEGDVNIAGIGSLVSVTVAEINRITGAGITTQAVSSIEPPAPLENSFELREDGGFELRSVSGS